MSDVSPVERGSGQVLRLDRRRTEAPRPRGRQPLSARWGESLLVRTYLEEIGRHPLLTAEEERQLAKSMERGRLAAEELVSSSGSSGSSGLPPDRREELARKVAEGEKARRRFVECNLRLVVSVARRYPTSGLALLDLVQEGNIGLLRAVDRFDHRRGFRFSTYAMWSIRQAITRAIANTGRTIRLPVHVCDLLGRIEKARRVLEADLGRPPDATEMAASLGMAKGDVLDALGRASDPTSLSALTGDDGQEMGDVVPDTTSPPVPMEALAGTVRAEVEGLLCLLDDRERHVVGSRFGLDGAEPRTLAAVAADVNLSVQRVAQIEKGAIAKLRRSPRATRERLLDLLAG